MSELSNYLILVVEDTVEFAKVTMMMLERIGFRTHHAVDGQTAITFLTDNRPDVVLLDLHLPGVNGWQVLEHIHATYGVGNIPIIVTSAYSDGANRVIGKLQEVRHYLIKPFSQQTLTNAVLDVLGLPQKV